MKPCSLAASRGVIRADDERDARRVAATVRRIAVGADRPASEPLLVESFVPGDEVALEGLLTDGRLEVLLRLDQSAAEGVEVPDVHVGCNVPGHRQPGVLGVLRLPEPGRVTGLDL